MSLHMMEQTPQKGSMSTYLSNDVGSASFSSMSRALKHLKRVGRRNLDIDVFEPDDSI
jgi:hypothetical protein